MTLIITRIIYVINVVEIFHTTILPWQTRSRKSLSLLPLRNPCANNYRSCIQSCMIQQGSVISIYSRLRCGDRLTVHTRQSDHHENSNIPFRKNAPQVTQTAAHPYPLAGKHSGVTNYVPLRELSPVPISSRKDNSCHRIFLEILLWLE